MLSLSSRQWIAPVVAGAVLSAIAIPLLSAIAIPLHAAPITLAPFGAAADYTVLTTDVTMDVALTGGAGGPGLSGANVLGLVGIYGGTHAPDVSLTGDSHITTLDLYSTGTYTTTGTSSIGTINQNAATDAKILQAMTDANAGSTTVAGYAATATTTVVGDFNNENTSVIGNGGFNVISVAALKLNSGQTLTITGTAADSFYFNVEDDFTFNNADVVLVGIQAYQVVFNALTAAFGGNGHAVAINGNDTHFRGYLAATDRDVNITAAQVTGGIWGDGHRISIVSGADVHGVEFPTGGPLVPEPSSIVLLGTALAGFVGLSWMRRNCA